MHQLQSFIHHAQVRRYPFSPGIPVSNLFNYALLFFCRFTRYLNVKSKIGAYGKGRVNINQFQPAFLFYFIS